MGGHHGHFGFENFEAILTNVCVIFIRLENADYSLFIRQDFMAWQESKRKVDVVVLQGRTRRISIIMEGIVKVVIL